MAPNHRENLAQHMHISSADDLSYSVSPSSGINDTIHTIVTGRKCWKTMKGKGEVVWPPYLEAALVEGLEKYQPVESRTSRSFGRFPMRNKFISDYIFNVTGKRRTPKQVGSRLQQLRDTTEGKRILQQLSSKHLAMMQPKAGAHARSDASSSLPSASGSASSSGASGAASPARPGTASSTPAPPPAPRTPSSFVCIDVIPDPGSPLPPLRLPALGGALPSLPSLSSSSLSSLSSSSFSSSSPLHPSSNTSSPTTATPATLANFVPSPTASPAGAGLALNLNLGPTLGAGLQAPGPRVLRHIDPSVTFLSRAPLAAWSRFVVCAAGSGSISGSGSGSGYGLDEQGNQDEQGLGQERGEGQQGNGESQGERQSGQIHAERTELELLSSSCMPRAQWPSEMECSFLYRTRFVPRFWETLCRAADPSIYTITQEIVRAGAAEPPAPADILLSILFQFNNVSASGALSSATGAPGFSSAGAAGYSSATGAGGLGAQGNGGMGTQGMGAAGGTPPLSPDCASFSDAASSGGSGSGSRPGTAGSGASAFSAGSASDLSADLDDIMMFNYPLDAGPAMHPSHHTSHHTSLSSHNSHSSHHNSHQHSSSLPAGLSSLSTHLPPLEMSIKSHTHSAHGLLHHAAEEDAYGSLPPTPSSPLALSAAHLGWHNAHAQGGEQCGQYGPGSGMGLGLGGGMGLGQGGLGGLGGMGGLSGMGGLGGMGGMGGMSMGSMGGMGGMGMGGGPDVAIAGAGQFMGYSMGHYGM